MSEKWDVSKQLLPVFTGKDYCNPSERCGKCKNCLSLIESHHKSLGDGPVANGKPIPDHVTRKDLGKALEEHVTQSDLDDLVGSIKTKFISDDDLIQAAKGIAAGIKEKILPDYARKKDLDDIRDLISAVSESGGSDLESMLGFVKKLKAEIQVEMQTTFEAKFEEIRQATAKLAVNNESKIFEWGEKLEARIDGVKLALENIRVNVNASMPPATVNVSVPEQAPPVVNVESKITMPRRKIKREILYDAQSGRPKSLLDVEEFLDQETPTETGALVEGEKAGVRQSRGSVGGAGTTYGSLFKKPRKT